MGGCSVCLLKFNRVFLTRGLNDFERLLGWGLGRFLRFLVGSGLLETVLFGVDRGVEVLRTSGGWRIPIARTYWFGCCGFDPTGPCLTTRSYQFRFGLRLFGNFLLLRAFRLRSLTAISDINGLWLLSAEDSPWVVQSCGKTQLLRLESDVLPLTVES